MAHVCKGMVSSCHGMLASRRAPRPQRQMPRPSSAPCSPRSQQRPWTSVDGNAAESGSSEIGQENPDADLEEVSNALDANFVY